MSSLPLGPACFNSPELNARGLCHFDYPSNMPIKNTMGKSILVRMGAEFALLASRDVNDAHVVIAEAFKKSHADMEVVDFSELSLETLYNPTDKSLKRITMTYTRLDIAHLPHDIKADRRFLRGFDFNNYLTKAIQTHYQHILQPGTVIEIILRDARDEDKAAEDAEKALKDVQRSQS
jgi:hypothetical protein